MGILATNRYSGNSGKMVKIPDPDPAEIVVAQPQIIQTMARSQSPQVLPDGRAPARKTSSPFTKKIANQSSKTEEKSGISSILSGLTGGITEKFSGLKDGVGDAFGGISDGLGGVVSKFKNWEFETEDLIIFLIIYLMYRESKDQELLIILGVMLFL